MPLFAGPKHNVWRAGALRCIPGSSFPPLLLCSSSAAGAATPGCRRRRGRNFAAAGAAGAATAVAPPPPPTAAAGAGGGYVGTAIEEYEAPLNTVVILGSTRKKRVGTRVGDYLVGQLTARGGGTVHNVTVIDPRTTEDGFFMTLMTKAHFHYRKGEDVPPALAATAAVLRAADCYIVCTPEYNHTIAPGLTNTMNYFGSSVYAQKPSGIATYSAGAWGGARCGVALRAYLSELGCLPVSATFQLERAWRDGTWDEEGQLSAESMAAKSATRMIEQLEWHAKAMRAARKLEAS